MKNDHPLLNSIVIAKPCTAKWETMTGDERERACQLCHLNVYNVSAMTGREAESFLRERMPKGRVCVRLYQRADGTVITENCPRGLRAARDATKRAAHQVATVVSLLLTWLTGSPSFSQAVEGASVAGPRFLTGEPVARASITAPVTVNYGPKVVNLSGVIKKEVFPGAPNFENVKTGDQPETCWMLHLTIPVDVAADKPTDTANEAEHQVTVIQLLTKTDDTRQMQELTKQCTSVTVTGNLFHGHTGHHHAKVLMDVMNVVNTAGAGAGASSTSSTSSTKK